ncbi:MAG TPA: TM0106 family RecB-like putative nuclease [Candidatus Limnocylindria bacterium]|nr:TM0106 family RecB-like putative nuclease [Candidatus Limnocylindria bacterium]
MQLIDGRPVYSASDLVGFLACEHLTALDRAALAGLVERPHLDDPELDVLRRRGEQHEERYLETLEAEGRSVIRIALDGSISDHGEQLRAAAAETERAMATGADVIYQATFFDGTWRGHADFLLRVDASDRPSRWGAYHYEVADTKLARHVKAGAVLQICTYVDMLTAIQGIEPSQLHVVLGGSAGGLRTLRVADYMAYYRLARSRFDAAVGPTAPAASYPPAPTYPEPVEHCEVCRWRLVCDRRWRDDDHLSLVAGISRRQRRALEARTVGTLAELAVLPLPVDPPLTGVSRSAVERVREQARIQREGRERNETLYELLVDPEQPVEPGVGLAGLPPPSAGDLFFDIEGDPYAAADGLDYLFGVMDLDGAWHPIWSRDADGEFTLHGEKRAFEAVVDLFIARLWSDPEAHIYHFAPYEPTALKRLMGRHATKENEVDRLLRGGALVDLHRLVRQSIRASVEGYGIKRLEPLYGFTRSVDLRDAGSSIVAFEQWLQLGEGDRPSADHLARIEGYNRDDVVSNRRLRDWLEERRDELAQRTGTPVPRPGPRDPEPTPGLNERQMVVAAMANRLTADVPDEDRSPEEQARWLLAQLLSWHRREKKSSWWLFFHLKDELTDAERIEASEPLSGLEYIGVVEESARARVHRYRFPTQEYEVKVGGTVVDPNTWGIAGAAKNPGDVVALDEGEHTIDLRRTTRNLAPHPTALIPFDDYRTPEQEDSLLRLAEWVADHGLAVDGPHRAALDLLLARAPRVGQPDGAPLREPNQADLQAARRLAQALDRSTLPVQGPPGSGKTYSGARMALDLVRAGKRVGVTANSHKVITNFLTKLLEAAAEGQVAVSVIQKPGKDDPALDHAAVQSADSNEEVRDALQSRAVTVAAGTTWLWARKDMIGTVDTLFVDEAGQMSLANVLAAAGSAESVVLLGDPQQLDQPLQGSHPPGADRSALAHLLGERATIADDRGLFLERTWRLHPDLCAYTSEVFYESRLEPEPHLSVQGINGQGALSGTGPRLVDVAHEGNDNESPEEAARVAELTKVLVDGGATWIDEHGHERPIGWDEIAIVAAYNSQVGEIRKLLPHARVGTVDKFQGQEAPISVYSMASSSAEDAPRGMSFLYSRHRLNVATSRARCMAVVVASPDLLRVRARSPEEMRLANALARFAEMARG